MAGTIDVVRGTVRVPAKVARAYFSGIDAVAVVIDGTVLRILPIHHATAGGCLLKQRNAAGDKVAAAFDVFESRGLGDWEAFALPTRWSTKDAALLAEIPENLTT